MLEDAVAVNGALENIFSPREVPADGPGMYQHENYTTRITVAHWCRHLSCVHMSPA